VHGKNSWLTPMAGGTDFAGAFIGGLSTLPVVAGEMQCRCLGASVEAWSEPDANGVGRPLIDEVGELVCTRPMPSMPLCFWGDAAQALPPSAQEDGAAGEEAADGHGRRQHARVRRDGECRLRGLVRRAGAASCPAIGLSGAARAAGLSRVEPRAAGAARARAFGAAPRTFAMLRLNFLIRGIGSQHPAGRRGLASFRRAAGPRRCPV
jgi:hypothetical protein